MTINRGTGRMTPRRIIEARESIQEQLPDANIFITSYVRVNG